jgi:gingipain R
MKKLLKSKLTIALIALVLVSVQCFSALYTTADPSENNSFKEDSIVEMMKKENDVNVTVLESDSNRTVMRFDINNFSKNLVNIDNNEYYNIVCEGTGVAYEQGMPELPRISRSIAIPSDSEAKLNIISSEYEDYKKLPIAPSKGSITRDKKPKDIPYTFDNIYKQSSFYPSVLATLSQPFIMRELSGVTVTVNAFQYHPSNKTLRVYKSVTVEVITDKTSTVNSISASNNNRITEDFIPTYQNTFINYKNIQAPTQGIMNNPSETGSLLIITYDQFSSALTPFVQWKNSKGINTTVVNRSVVSSTNNPAQIKSYIQNYYNQHPELTYVLLVGDYAQISSPAYSDGVSDPEYTKVAGNDNYPDIYVGRFSAESLTDVQTQVQRTIEFEQNGYNTTTWFKKGIGIASAESAGGESDIQHMDIIRNKLLNDNYTLVDRIYDPNALASSVSTSLNQGRGIINYVGHGSDTYWVTTGFNNTNIKNLQNPGQLPFILSVACVNGTFQKSTTCFAETWLRSRDSSGSPIGAIGALMSTVNQPWTPPMVGQDKIIDLLVNDSRISLGGLCYSGETAMLDNGTSSDILTFNTWTLFGDPSIQILPSGTSEPKQWYYETKTYESPHNYTNNYNGNNEYLKTGAAKVQVHFSRFETEKGYDFVNIKDKNGNTISKHDGTLAPFWAAVDGDKIVINLVTDSSITKYGYTIDQVAYYSGSQLIIQDVDITVGNLD